MVASTDIKFYVHTNNNSPQLQNAYGSMINVLDACLINGINIGTVSSLTASGTTVTVLFSSAHNLMQYQVIKIVGAAQTEYNGQHRILTIPSPTTVTFELAAAPTASPATGTISASLPPLGWEKPFSSINTNGGGKAAYRSTNLLLPSRPFLRVVDELDPAWTSTYAKYAKVGIVEGMIDIDTMLGVQAPYNASFPDKNWVGTGSGASAYNGWSKWYYARAQAAGTSGNQFDNSATTDGNRKWMIIGNQDFFYILPSVTAVNPNQVLYGFGAYKSLINPDNANNFLACSDYYAAANVASNPSLGAGMYSTGSTNTAYSNLLLQRKYNSTLYNNARCASFGQMNSSFYSGVSDYFQNTDDIPFAPVIILDYFQYSDDFLVPRGKAPLINWLFNQSPYVDMSVINKNGIIYFAKSIAVGNLMGQILIELGGGM